jgi:hypothetical protein
MAQRHPGHPAPTLGVGYLPCTTTSEVRHPLSMSLNSVLPQLTVMECALWISGQFDQAHGIATDSKNNVFVAENRGRRIHKFRVVQ